VDHKVTYKKPRLVLLRHGQSQANLEGRFAGWEDSALTGQGRKQAAQAARLMIGAGIDFDVAYTSMLGRAVMTLDILLDNMGRREVERRLTWRLNERHCGVFQGRPKSEAVDDHDRPLAWRTEFDVSPPSLTAEDPRHPRHDRRYGQIDPETLPGAESLATALKRLRPLWDRELAPRLRAGQSLLVAAHGHVLWLLTRCLPNIEAFEHPRVSIPNANPLVIELEIDLTCRSVRYLDQSRPA
jgi:2,3-bisphosphoglycerate-dependent phosphoglycerate mutase